MAEVRRSSTDEVRSSRLRPGRRDSETIQSTAARMIASAFTSVGSLSEAPRNLRRGLSIFLGGMGSRHRVAPEPNSVSSPVGGLETILEDAPISKPGIFTRADFYRLDTQKALAEFIVKNQPSRGEDLGRESLLSLQREGHIKATTVGEAREKLSALLDSDHHSLAHDALTYLESPYPEAAKTKDFAFRSVGSVNLKSDNDYSVTVNRYLAGGISPRGAGEPNMDKLRSDYKSLLSEANRAVVLGKTEEMLETATTDHVGRARVLTPEKRLRAMVALQNANYNWFESVATYADSKPQLLWDIRSLQMEFTNGCAKALDKDYTNVSETDFVRNMNRLSRDVFGLETGTLFDTNYYTSHTALKEGIVVLTPAAKKRMDTKNLTQAMTKVAENFRKLYGSTEGAAKFREFKSTIEEGVGSNAHLTVPEETFEMAWTAANTQAERIEEQIKEVRSKTITAIQDLYEQLQDADTATEASDIQNEIDRIGKKLTPRDLLKLKQTHLTETKGSDIELAEIAGKLNAEDPTLDDISDECRIQAMNMLYENALGAAQDQFNAALAIEHTAEQHFERLGVSDKRALPLFKSGTDTDFEELARLIPEDADRGGEIAQLKDFREQFDFAITDAIAAQTEALLYANEPYYSRGTIMVVVAGIQMGKIHMSAENLAAAKENFSNIDDPATLAQSTSENFGDFTKDYHHYEHADPPGKFLFRGAKYLFRLAFSAKIAGLEGDVGRSVDRLANAAVQLQDLRGRAQGSDKEKAQEALEILQKELPKTFGEIDDPGTASKLLFKYTQGLTEEVLSELLSESEA